jgi:hypothetical protein
MLVFYTQEEFYEWLPLQMDDVLEYSGITKEEFYGRYLLDGVAQLDKEDVRDLMEELLEVQFENHSKYSIFN